MKIVDRTGLRYGKLTVLQRAEDCIVGKRKRKTRWVCECDCGKMITVTSDNLRSGHTISCGCAKKGVHVKHGDAVLGNVNRIYHIWAGMIQRCENKNSGGYFKYGGRGISVCREWHEYETFKAWAKSNGYRDDLSIDRIDNDGNYEPPNCRWATAKQQANNRRPAHVLRVD